MNLKKAFRFQNNISALLNTAQVELVMTDNYLTSKIYSYKSELNKVALVKDYVDEEKEITDNTRKQYGFTNNMETNTNKKRYNISVIIKVIHLLLEERELITEAIVKAKSKAKIPIKLFNKEEQIISYDTAIALNTAYRSFIERMGITKSNLVESTCESKVSEKVLVSTEQPPTDIFYTIKKEITFNTEDKEYIEAEINTGKRFCDDLSEAIEAAKLTIEVKYTPKFVNVDTFEDLYKLLDNQNAATLD